MQRVHHGEWQVMYFVVDNDFSPSASKYVQPVEWSNFLDIGETGLILPFHGGGQ